MKLTFCNHYILYVCTWDLDKTSRQFFNTSTAHIEFYEEMEKLSRYFGLIPSIECQDLANYSHACSSKQTRALLAILLATRKKL